MSTTTTWDACATCGYQFDQATATPRPAVRTTYTEPHEERIDHYEEPKPTAGCVTLCLNCGELLVFGTDLRTSLAPDERVLQLSDDEREFIERAQTAIRQRGHLPRHGRGVAS